MALMDIQPVTEGHTLLIPLGPPAERRRLILFGGRPAATSGFDWLFRGGRGVLSQWAHRARYRASTPDTAVVDGLPPSVATCGQSGYGKPRAVEWCTAGIRDAGSACTGLHRRFRDRKFPAAFRVCYVRHQRVAVDEAVAARGVPLAGTGHPGERAASFQDAIANAWELRLPPPTLAWTMPGMLLSAATSERLVRLPPVRLRPSRTRTRIRNAPEAVSMRSDTRSGSLSGWTTEAETHVRIYVRGIVANASFGAAAVAKRCRTGPRRTGRALAAGSFGLFRTGGAVAERAGSIVGCAGIGPSRDPVDPLDRRAGQHLRGPASLAYGGRQCADRRCSPSSRPGRLSHGHTLDRCRLSPGASPSTRRWGGVATVAFETRDGRSASAASSNRVHRASGGAIQDR